MSHNEGAAEALGHNAVAAVVAALVYNRSLKIQLEDTRDSKPCPERLAIEHCRNPVYGLVVVAHIGDEAGTVAVETLVAVGEG